jgi:hypothetical protein
VRRVSSSDILRFGLDGRLRLSVLFIVPTEARRAKITSFEEIQYEGDIQTLHGVFDLPLIDSERYHIENEIQRLTAGPKICINRRHGAFVQCSEGHLFLLQRSTISWYNEYPNLSSNTVAIFDEGKANTIIDFKNGDFESYVASEYLPYNTILIIRTESLEEFESAAAKSFMGWPEKGERENRKAIVSLLKIIIAMAVNKYHYDPNLKKSGIPNEIAREAEQLGIRIDVDTVRKYLKMASEEFLDQDIL